MGYKIGAFQLQDIQGNIDASLDMIEACLSEADEAGLKVVAFPECFLQGYTLDAATTRERAINLESEQFKDILVRLALYKATAIVGMIEEEVGQYFNTAAIIRQGQLLGKYQKVHLFETNFQPGVDQPVFTVDELTFGVNICYDARFADGADELARKGAQAIFYILNNRLSREKANAYRDRHIPNLAQRAIETGCVVVSSDVIAQDKATLGYGCSAIVDAQGAVIRRVPELSTGMVAI